MRITVIIPTWRRRELLIRRALPSVAAQSYPGEVEVLVVSDGPDRDLREIMLETPGIRYLECRHHDPDADNYGARARNLGLLHATGDLIAYLDDDNAWRPDHLALLAKALDANPSAGFAYSRMLTHPQDTVIGTDPPRYGGIDTSLIMQRRELVDVAKWRTPRQISGDRHAPDWAIVADWLRAGVGWAHVAEITVDYHFPGS